MGAYSSGILQRRPPPDNLEELEKLSRCFVLYEGFGPTAVRHRTGAFAWISNPPFRRFQIPCSTFPKLALDEGYSSQCKEQNPGLSSLSSFSSSAHAPGLLRFVCVPSMQRAWMKGEIVCLPSRRYGFDSHCPQTSPSFKIQRLTW